MRSAMPPVHRHHLSLRFLLKPAAIALTAGIGLFAVAHRAAAADDKAPADKPAKAADAKPADDDKAAGGGDEKVTFAHVQVGGQPQAARRG